MCSDCSPNWEPPTPREMAEIDPIADQQDAKKAAREREQRRVAGIPEPTLAQVAQGFGKERVCVWCFEGPVTEGGYCVRCARVVFGRAS